MATILCVDDDTYLTDLLDYALKRADFTVLCAQTGREAWRMIRTERLDLLLLDVNLPDMSGFDLLEKVRTFSSVPVLMLTARSQDEDVINGYEHGADDYVIKPFNVLILVNRIKALLRRVQLRQHSAPPDQSALSDEPVLSDKDTYHIGDALFDAEMNEIVGPNERIKLTRTQSQILRLLCQHENRVLPADRIIELIWGYDSESDIGLVRTHIHHLREKIASLPGSPQPIGTVTGVGYVMRKTTPV